MQKHVSKQCPRPPQQQQYIRRQSQPTDPNIATSESKQKSNQQNNLNRQIHAGINHYQPHQHRTATKLIFYPMNTIHRLQIIVCVLFVVDEIVLQMLPNFAFYKLCRQNNAPMHPYRSPYDNMAPHSIRFHRV